MNEFSLRRDALYEGLKSIDGIKLPGKPEGAFYIFPDFSEFVPKNISNEESKLHIYISLSMPELQPFMVLALANTFRATYGFHIQLQILNRLRKE